MATFVKGQRVQLPRSVRPSVMGGCIWVGPMGAFVGLTGIIEDVGSQCGERMETTYKVHGWYWAESWLEPIEESPAKPRALQVGDRVRVVGLAHDPWWNGAVGVVKADLAGEYNVNIGTVCDSAMAQYIGTTTYWTARYLELLTPARPVTVTAPPTLNLTRPVKWTTSKETWALPTVARVTRVIDLPESLHARTVDVLSGLSDSHIPSLGQVQAIRAVLHDLMGLVRGEKK